MVVLAQLMAQVAPACVQMSRRQSRHLHSADEVSLRHPDGGMGARDDHDYDLDSHSDHDRDRA